MHTAHTLAANMFQVEIDGRAAGRDDLIAPHPFVRVGIVVNTPLGGTGGCLLLQLGITAYFDTPGKDRRQFPHYAEIYVFHAGARRGDFSPFDIWPSRREIDVPNNGPDLLAAINGVGITHLLLPDGPITDPLHYFKEPNVAFDRIERVFVYDPSGRTANANIRVSTADPSPLEDISGMLDPKAMHAYYSGSYDVPEAEAERIDHIAWLEALQKRLPEVSDADRERARNARAALVDDGVTTETYREISVAEALTRL